MKRLFYELLTMFSPSEEDKRRLMGDGEYFADKGIGNDIDDCPRVVKGEALVQLSKHLKHI